MKPDTDHRSEAERAETAYYAIATDKFMSGWGGAPGRSLFAVPCRTREDAEIAADNLRARGEMKRVRIVAAWNLCRVRRRSGDHLSVGSMGAWWFQPGYYAAQNAKRRAGAR